MTAAQKRRFAQLVRGLNDLIADIRKDYPEANYYLEESTMIVLSGQSHEGANLRRRRDRIMATEQLHYSGGGAW